jgi:hypothetical protein
MNVKPYVERRTSDTRKRIRRYKFESMTVTPELLILHNLFEMLDLHVHSDNTMVWVSKNLIILREKI